MTSADEKEDGKVPGLPEVLALVPDPCKRRGRRYQLVFILAVAVACAPSGARNFRGAGDHAADLPQDVLARLGERPRAVFDAIQEQGPRKPDHAELDRSHGRIIRCSMWVADAAGIDFPHVSQVTRIRRDRYDTDGALVSKETVHAVTSLDAEQASAEALAGIARSQWGISACTSAAVPSFCRISAGSRPVGRREGIVRAYEVLAAGLAGLPPAPGG